MQLNVIEEREILPCLNSKHSNAKLYDPKDPEDSGQFLETILLTLHSTEISLQLWKKPFSQVHRVQAFRREMKFMRFSNNPTAD